MLNLLKCLCAIALLAGGIIASGSDAFAQGKKTVTGVVSDNLGPVPGAGVVVKKTTDGTVTDFDGRYSIQVREGDVLVFSCMGYAIVEMTVGKQSVIDVKLSDDSTVLDEVVVVG